MAFSFRYLFLDGVAVHVAIGAIDDLIRQALSDGLEVAERVVAGSGGHQVDGLVHAAQGRHIDGLTTHHTGGPNSGRVFAGTTSDDCVAEDLEGVLAGDQVNDLEALTHDADRLPKKKKKKNNLHLTIIQATISGLRDFLWDLFLAFSLKLCSFVLWDFLLTYNFLPLLRPCIIKELVNRSTKGH